MQRKNILVKGKLLVQKLWSKSGIDVYKDQQEGQCANSERHAQLYWKLTKTSYSDQHHSLYINLNNQLRIKRPFTKSKSWTKKARMNEHLNPDG